MLMLTTPENAELGTLGSTRAAGLSGAAPELINGVMVPVTGAACAAPNAVNASATVSSFFVISLVTICLPRMFAICVFNTAARVSKFRARRATLFSIKYLQS
jgi:hypothetical protein